MSELSCPLPSCVGMLLSCQLEDSSQEYTSGPNRLMYLSWAPVWSLQAAHEDTAGPCRLHLVWSASDEAQEYWSSSQELALTFSLEVVPCSS